MRNVITATTNSTPATAISTTPKLYFAATPAAECEWLL